MTTREPGNITGMTPARLLTLADIAEVLGLEYRTVRNYHQLAERHRREGDIHPGDFPEPDMRFGRSPVWKVSTINAWRQHRPGRGAGGGRPPRNDDDWFPPLR